MQYAGPSRPPSPVPSTHPVISLLYEPIPLLPSISFWAGGGGGKCCVYFYALGIINSGVSLGRVFFAVSSFQFHLFSKSD